MFIVTEYAALKYVSDEIMSTLSLAQDYPTVFNIQGTFSCLLYFC